MASFKAHLSTSIVSGSSIAGIGIAMFSLNLIQALTICIMGIVGGILPDIDSDSGKPLRFLFSTISILLPTLFLSKIVGIRDSSPEFMVSYFFLSYMIIRYLICGIVKKITIHRGIMHSVPFAILFGEIGYLLFISSEPSVAVLAGLSIFTGYGQSQSGEP